MKYRASGIRNIIFDFGGVIIRIDHNSLEYSFRSLGIGHFRTLFAKTSQSQVFREFETGIVSPVQFRSILLQLLNLSLHESEFDKIWNSLIVGYDPAIIDLLKKVKQNYRTFILSNTNIIHYKYFTDLYKSEFNSTIDDLVVSASWSFITGMRKPDREIYEHLLESHALNPHETLFIDDTPANIETAGHIGLKTHLIKQDNELQYLFDRQGFLI